MSKVIGTIPYTNIFSLQDVANVVGYNNLLDCEAYSNYESAIFPGGNANIGTLKHYNGYYRHYAWMTWTSITSSITICPHSDKRILFLQIQGAELPVRTASAPTLNGVSFTQAGNNNGINNVENWYMINPPVGTYNLYIQTDTLIGFELYIVPYINTVSLYSTAYQSGNSNTPLISLSTPSTNSIVLISERHIQAAQVTNRDFDAWFRHSHWATSGSNGRGEVGVSTYGNPLTVNYTLEQSASWQIAAAVFSIS
jgi:hypothetical protein